MQGKLKKLILSVAILFLMVSFGGCAKKKGADISSYLNNTLEYFINDTKIDVEQAEDGSYVSKAKQLSLVIKDNIIQSITLTGKASGFGIEGVVVGDKQKKVNQMIEDEYTSKPEVSEDEANKTTTYAYQKMNRLFSIVYNSENVVTSITMEITDYTVGSEAYDGPGDGQIDKSEIMVTVGNIDVSYSEAMVYLRTAQQIYEAEFGNDVWSFDLYGNGTTVGSVLKQEVLNQIIQLEVMNVVANEQDITLNDDEMLEVRGFADDFMKTVSDEDQLRYGLNQDLAVQVFATNMIAKKLYETVTIDVDTDVDDEDAMQSRLYRLFIKDYGLDSKGNRTELTASEHKEIKERAKALHKQALETTDFLTFAESNSDDDKVEYVVSKNDLDAKEAKAAFSLKDGEVSDVLKTEDGYVIWYCQQANDEDATLQVKESIIEQRRSDLFVKLYTEWYSKYQVKVNMKLWNQLELTPIEKK